MDRFSAGRVSYFHPSCNILSLATPSPLRDNREIGCSCYTASAFARGLSRQVTCVAKRPEIERMLRDCFIFDSLASFFLANLSNITSFKR